MASGTRGAGAAQLRAPLLWEPGAGAEDLKRLDGETPRGLTGAFKLDRVAKSSYFLDLKNRANICQSGAGAAGAINRLNGALRAAEDSPGFCSSCLQSLVFCSAVYELA